MRMNLQKQYGIGKIRAFVANQKPLRLRSGDVARNIQKLETRN